jgi:hypothetical protein
VADKIDIRVLVEYGMEHGFHGGHPLFLRGEQRAPQGRCHGRIIRVGIIQHGGIL